MVLILLCIFPWIVERAFLLWNISDAVCRDKEGRKVVIAGKGTVDLWCYKFFAERNGCIFVWKYGHDAGNFRRSISRFQPLFAFECSVKGCVTKFQTHLADFLSFRNIRNNLKRLTNRSSPPCRINPMQVCSNQFTDSPTTMKVDLEPKAWCGNDVWLDSTHNVA